MKGVKLTPDLLALLYRALLETQPFSGWIMPPCGSVRFEVSGAKDVYGDATPINGGPIGFDYRVRVSKHKNGTVLSALETLAHEMVHLHLFCIGKGNAQHGPEFKRCAEQVCKFHGFDPKRF